MTIKPVLWEDLVHYDEKIKKYIQNNVGGTIEGSGIEIYENYSKLPLDITEKTIAYCENDYIDNTDATTYKKGLYFYDVVGTTWKLININVEVDLSELEDALDDLDMYLDKDTYMSEVNQNSVKLADVAKSLEGTELAKPYQFWGINSQGEAKYQYLPFVNNESIGNYNLEQREILNVVANEVLEIESINKLDDAKIIIQALRYIVGEKNLQTTIESFNVAHKDDFYYSDKVCFSDTGSYIKNEHIVKSIANEDLGCYETSIDLQQFSNIINISGKGV